MTKDEIQKALNEIPKDGNYDAEYLLEWFYYHQKTVICALEAQLTKTEENVTCGGLSNIPEGWQWQPIETAPKDGTYVLVCEKDNSAIYEARFMWDDWFPAMQSDSDEYDPMKGFPSHWMPLPEPPQERKTK